MRILLVEDDVILGDGIQAGLIQAGFGIDWARSCGDAKLAIEIGAYAGLILDIGLPDGSGLDLLRDLRRADNAIPVLLLTARDTLNDRVHGLNTGADDYLVKPFELDELIARMRALLRRSRQRASPVVCYQGIELDPVTHTVTFNGDLVEMPQREFTLLEEFLENQGRVLTRSQLEQSLYGWNAEVESNAIEVHVHHLRKKFGSDFIKTIRGIGYVLNKLQG